MTVYTEFTGARDEFLLINTLLTRRTTLFAHPGLIRGIPNKAACIERGTLFPARENKPRKMHARPGRIIAEKGGRRKKRPGKGAVPPARIQAIRGGPPGGGRINRRTYVSSALF